MAAAQVVGPAAARQASIYLDHASTTPLRAEAAAAMSPYLTDLFGNPSGLHSTARAARRALDAAREELAAALGAEPGEIVFTSGGTESDNLAVCGVHVRLGGTVVCSALEHPAVLAATEAVGGIVVPVGPDGLVDLEQLADTLRNVGPESVSLVSVMLVNNEIGTIQPLEDVARVVAQVAPAALLHTDAVAGMGWLDVARLAARADLVSVSGHKLGAGRGAGALVVRNRARSSLAPIMHGGGQEGDLRSGTQNVPAIAALALAATLAVAEREEAVARVSALRDRLADGVLHAVPSARETSTRAQRVAGTCHLAIPGTESEELLLLLDRAGIAASAGSACASGALEPSHVLLAMGMSTAEARSCIRFSLGHSTTAEDVDTAAGAVGEAVARLAS